MASPQIEDGYVRISRELLSAFCYLDASGPEFMIVLAVISKTYGWNKKEDKISLSMFQKLTKMTRPRTFRAIKQLVRRNVLGTTVVPGKIATYWIIKDYDKWVTGTCTVLGTARRTTTGTFEGGQLVRLPIYRTKDNTKDILKRAKSPINPDIKTFIDWWFVQYQDRFSQKYHVSGAKEGSIIKSLLKTYSIDELKLKAGTFLDSRDEWIQGAGYTIGVFQSQVNKFNKQTTAPRPI